MKIQALSDLHIEFEGHALEIPDVGADVLVLAGDIGRSATGVEWAAHQAERLGLTCIYVLGNTSFITANTRRPCGSHAGCRSGDSGVRLGQRVDCSRWRALPVRNAMDGPVGLCTW